MAPRTRSGKTFGKGENAVEPEQTHVQGQASAAQPVSTRTLRNKARIDYTEQLAVDNDEPQQSSRSLPILNGGACLRAGAANVAPSDASPLDASPWDAPPWDALPPYSSSSNTSPSNSAATPSAGATVQPCGFLEVLPAELRNRIYELVFGNKTIHVWHHDDYDDDEDYKDGVYIGPMLRSICTKEEEEKAHINKAETQDPAEEHVKHLEQHESCYVSPSTANPFALLQTCRQIHSEAALIPFYNNTFFFSTFIELDEFLRRLTPEQADAVQHIALTVTSTAGMPSLASIKLPSVKSYAKDWPEMLNGKLESLICVVEFGGDREDDFDVHKRKRSKELMEFTRLEIKNVKVVACNVPNWMHDPVSEIVSAKELKEWAGKVENALKKGEMEGDNRTSCMGKGAKD